MPMPFTTRRREMLQATAIGVAALATGCAAIGTGAKPRVVVVGGGWGGLGAVRGLLAGGGADVTLVEPNEGFMSCPLSAHFIAGFQPASDFQRSYARIDQLGARRVRERVTAIDRAKREVVTATQRLHYDFLVLSPGVEYMEDGIQGYAEARAQLPVGFRAFEQIAVRRQVDEFLAKGGNFVISAPKPPYRCPPAPYERAFLIAEQMKQRGTKGKIILIDANPNPMTLPIAKPILNGMKSLYASQIEYMPDTAITAVDMGKRQQVAEAITDRIAGKPPAAATGAVELPLGICWANVTHKDAININVASSVEPGQPPKLKFTVDPEHNARSGASATSWGNGMWKAMLG